MPGLGVWLGNVTKETEHGQHVPQTATNHFLSFKCLVYHLIEWNVSCLCAGMDLGFYLAKLYILVNNHHFPAS